MSDPRSITADALEILVARELRKASIEPVGLRRERMRAEETGFEFDLAGRLRAYDHSWSALIGCINRSEPIMVSDVIDIRARADDRQMSSALLCTTAELDHAARVRARESRVALLRVVDAQEALLQSGLIQPGQLPAWVPEFTLEVVSASAATGQLLEADQPELILRELRA